MRTMRAARMHAVFALDGSNDALAVFRSRHGGFSDYVVKP